MASLNPSTNIVVNAADVVASLPSFLADFIGPEKLERIWLVPLTTIITPGDIRANSGVVFDEPLVLSIPGVDAIGLVIGAAGDDTIFPLTVQIRPEVKLSVEMFVGLRLSSSYFKPVVLNQTTGAFEPDPTRTTVDVPLGTLELSITGEGKLGLAVSQGISLKPDPERRSIDLRTLLDSGSNS